MSDLCHDRQVVVRKKPHCSMGLGPLSLQELPQQPLHLTVPGVGTLHRFFGVKTAENGKSDLFDCTITASRKNTISA